MFVKPSDEGATFNPFTGKRVAIGESGYAVSRPGCEVKVPAAEFFDETRHYRILADYVDSVRLGADEYIGVWVAGDTVYLDVSIVLPERETAESIGRENGQEAIFEFESGRVIGCDEWELH